MYMREAQTNNLSIIILEFKCYNFKVIILGQVYLSIIILEFK